MKLISRLKVLKEAASCNLYPGAGRNHCWEGVHVLAALDEGIVAADMGRYMALAFHPELGGDLRLHERFLQNLGF